MNIRTVEKCGGILAQGDLKWYSPTTGLAIVMDGNTQHLGTLVPTKCSHIQGPVYDHIKDSVVCSGCGKRASEVGG